MLRPACRSQPSPSERRTSPTPEHRLLLLATTTHGVRDLPPTSLLLSRVRAFGGCQLKGVPAASTTAGTQSHTLPPPPASPAYLHPSIVPSQSRTSPSPRDGGGGGTNPRGWAGGRKSSPKKPLGDPPTKASSQTMLQCGAKHLLIKMMLLPSEDHLRSAPRVLRDASGDAAQGVPRSQTQFHWRRESSEGGEDSS